MWLLKLLFLCSASILFACSRPITVEVSNRSEQRLANISIVYTGGKQDTGPTRNGEKRLVHIYATGESNLALEVEKEDGSKKIIVIDTYFERGYRGKIEIVINKSLEAEAEVDVRIW